MSVNAENKQKSINKLGELKSKAKQAPEKQKIIALIYENYAEIAASILKLGSFLADTI
jgi:hypothetical protein